MKNRFYHILYHFCLMGGLAITVQVSNAQTINQNLSLCKGDIFRGHTIENDTAILIQHQNPALADTLFNIHAIPPVMTFLNEVLCPGESFLGLPFLKDTTVARIYPNATTGCDSIVYYVLTVKNNSSLLITGDTAFCKGESRTLSVGFYPNYTWSTGETIREKVVTSGGVYTVSITDADGCTLISTVTVIVSDPQSDPETISPNCPNIHDGLIDLAPTGGIPPYNFGLNGQPQQSNGLFSGLPPGSYTTVVSDAIGCRDTIYTILNEPDPLAVNVPEEIILTAGGTADPEVTVTGNPVEITWSPADGLSCTDCLSPEMIPSITTRYVVVLKNTNGCSATDSVLITIDQSRKIYIPNVFQPDNEPFTIFSGEGVVEILSFRIFDRWGELVHHVGKQQPGDTQLGWNGESKGKKSPADVYLYEVQVLFGGGVDKLFHGDVLLLR